MLALALFIAAGAPNAARALLDARSVLRGSNRRLSTANFEELKLVAADAAAGDSFGNSLAIDGDTVVIGAPEAGTGGAVYVLRTTDGGATYDEVAKLTASDAAAGDDLGISVAIDGDTVVIGAQSGAVYVFRTTDGGATYGQVAKLTAVDAGGFGRSVAIDGNTIVVGSYYDYDAGAGSDSGSAYVFITTDGGASYGQVAKLRASDGAAGDWFGYSVAIDGDTVVVGACKDNDGGWSSGSAYVYRTTDGGAAYGQVAKLTASDGAEWDYFGYSVAIDGDTVVVGAFHLLVSPGAAYVFRKDDGGATYSQVAKLTADDAALADSEANRFGYSVAIDGGTVVVGAYNNGNSGWPSYSGGLGAVYVFRTTDGGATYGQVAKLTASDAAADDRFGLSVAIDGATIVVGAPVDDDAGSKSGSAYVYSDAGSEGLVADSDSAQTLGSDAATRTGPLLALLVAAVLAL